MRKLWPIVLLLGCGQPAKPVVPDPKFALIDYLQAIDQLPDYVRIHK
jgi:hypothetical protein